MAEPAEKRYYLACLDLEGQSCLVVGGGRIALEKLDGLLDCGARVTVVAPEALPEVQALDLDWIQREYRADDLDGRFLVIAATNIRSLNEQVALDAGARSLICNVVDDPELCTFILPAIYRNDPIAIAITTGGASPALAQRIRDDVSQRYGPEYAALARKLRDLRPWAKENFATYDERKEFFQALVEQELGAPEDEV